MFLRKLKDFAENQRESSEYVPLAERFKTLNECAIQEEEDESGFDPGSLYDNDGEQSRGLSQCISP